METALRVTHISTNDVFGGAAKAAFRLHRGLRSVGVESSMLVQDRLGDDSDVYGPEGNLSKAIGKIRPYIDFGLLRLLCRRVPSRPFSVQFLPGSWKRRTASLQPDLVNLHWICGGFVSIESLARTGRPLVWTAHDMWPFTGGCHYSGECDGYTRTCGRCPLLGSRVERDMSRTTWLRKKASWRKTPLTIVAPSKFMADCVKRSSLFGEREVEIIPHGIDVSLYRPLDRATARARVGLPVDRRIVLFSAMLATSAPLKGFSRIQSALRRLGERRKDVEAVVIGAGEPRPAPDLGMPVRYLGRYQDDLSLSLLYAAADVTVIASDQESFSLVALESMACGTPCVAFPAGWIPEIVRHRVNGYLASPSSDDDLCEGMDFLMADEERLRDMGREARRSVERDYDVLSIAGRYRDLYGRVLQDGPRGSVGGRM